MAAVLQVLLSGLITGTIYGLLALGIVLVYRTTNVLNFAYGAIAAVCSCFLVVLMTGAHLSFWVAVPLTLVFGAVLGVVLERVFARPVLHAPVFTKVIATLALVLVLQTVALAIWPSYAEPIPLQTPFVGQAARIGGVFIPLTDVVILGTTAVLLALLSLFLLRTRLGIALRATADDLNAARLVGVPAARMFMLVWALSCVLAAVAGILFASQQQLAQVTLFDPILIFAFVGAVLGGLESLPGALIGGIVVGVADNVLALVLAGRHVGAVSISDPGLREALIFGGFVLVLLLRPRGLLGIGEQRRV